VHIATAPATIAHTGAQAYADDFSISSYAKFARFIFILYEYLQVYLQVMVYLIVQNHLQAYAGGAGVLAKAGRCTWQCTGAQITCEVTGSPTHSFKSVGRWKATTGAKVPASPDHPWSFKWSLEVGRRLLEARPIVGGKLRCLAGNLKRE